MSRRGRAIRWLALLAALSSASVIAWAQGRLSFDWRAIAPPLDGKPLVIRADAKGDGRFGAPRSGHRVHQGVDLEAPIGSPVRAIWSGRVVKAGRHRGMGRFIELEHRHHFHSLYGHLETIKVRLGQRVRQGQIIATVGKSGNAHSPLIKSHLHLEVHRKGEPIDPGTLGLAFVRPPTQEPVINAGPDEDE